MDQASVEQHQPHTANGTNGIADSIPSITKAKVRVKNKDSSATLTSGSTSSKRRCCDGNIPSCAACSSVYGTECVYDPNSDHRRKGVYKQDIDNLRTRNTTLQTLICAIRSWSEEEVPELVRQIRNCDSLDDLADSIQAVNNGTAQVKFESESPIMETEFPSEVLQFETELSGKMGQLRLENGSVSFIGGTSNLLFLGSSDRDDQEVLAVDTKKYPEVEDAIVSWTEVTSDPVLVVHLMNLYFTWHYAYFTTLSKSLFYRDFLSGKPTPVTKRTEYCTPLLVNAMLALGCHFTLWGAARTDPHDPATAGDHFFKEAKRLILENDEHEKARLATVQALALMSVREAGCGREAKGWVYSGMSFRMAYDLGLNVDSGSANRDEQETDARRITVWGCFLFDKCWSNYLGRQPQIPLSSMAVPKFDVFPNEEADTWRPYTDAGLGDAHAQPARTRAIALQISALCEISCDLLSYFYNPARLEKPTSKQAELGKLSDLHTRLEAWRKSIPKEMEPREGQLPSILVMHMFFQLLFIHLFRPFLKYTRASSPLPAHVSPRKFCTHAATMISKLLRIYKKTHGLRQVCNIVVYIAHSACTIHILNLPDKNSVRDIIHGAKHLEEIGENWLCARKTLGILSLVARRWKTGLPEEVSKIFSRNDSKFSLYGHNHDSPKSDTSLSLPTPSTPQYVEAREANYPTGPLKIEYSNSGTDSSPTGEPPFNGGIVSFPHSMAPPSHNSQPEQYYMPHDQQDLWKQEQAQHMSQAEPQPSPTLLFGGVESLVAESQDWWLRDGAIFFDNWYGADQSGILAGNGVPHDLGLMNYGQNLYGSNGGGPDLRHSY